MSNVKAMLHALSALDGPRRAYRDPQHDADHLQRVYKTNFDKGRKDLERARKWERLALERLAEAARIREQLDAAKAELARMSA